MINRFSLSEDNIQYMKSYIKPYILYDLQQVWGNILSFADNVTSMSDNISLPPSNKIIYNRNLCYVKYCDLYEVFLTFLIQEDSINMLKYIGWFSIGDDYYLVSIQEHLELLDTILGIINRRSLLSFLRQTFHLLHKLYKKYKFIHGDLYNNLFIKRTNPGRHLDILMLDYEFSCILMDDMYYTGYIGTYYWFTDIIELLESMQLQHTPNKDIIDQLASYFKDVQPIIDDGEFLGYNDKNFYGSYEGFLHLLDNIY